MDNPQSDMMKRNLHILLTAILVMTGTAAFAESPHEKVVGGKTIVYRQPFLVGSDKMMPSDSLLRFRDRIDSLVNANFHGNVSVTGFASIEGDRVENELLSSSRAMAVKDWLTTSTCLPATKILLFSNGQDWELFRRLVEDQPDVPSKDEVLGIINSDNTGSIKTNCLKVLSRGEPWRYFVKNIFPRMRVAIVSIDILTQDQTTPVAPLFVEINEKSEVSAVSDQSNLSDLSEQSDLSDLLGQPEEISAPDGCLGERMALKTNLLYDAALMPSLELEYKITDRWSVALEGNVAWWKNNPKHKYYQILTIIPEVKYHFNPDRQWAGHYVGLFAGGGKYDLENGGKGYYGEGGMLGVSYNYVFNVSKHLSFEAGIGVGALYTRYKEYIPVNGYYLYQTTKHTWYGGPLRLKFALEWRFWDYKCKGGKR